MTSIKMLLSYNNNAKVVEMPVIPNELSEILQEFSNEEIITHIALGCDGVSDITDFKVNGEYANIICAETEIFTLREFIMEVEE